MELVVRSAEGISPEERAARDALWAFYWPPNPDEAQPAELLDEAVAHVLVLEEGAVIAACELQDRTISVNGEPRRVAGLRGVAVEQKHQRRGYGKRLVLAWVEEARARGYEWGMLFCRLHMVPFYEDLGWTVLQGEITYSWLGTEHRVAGKDLGMVIPLTRPAAVELPAWRTVRIHVCVDTW